MEQTTTSDVRAEIDITENGVAVHLLSDDGDTGDTTVDATYLTFDELAERAGENIELQLSDTEPETEAVTETDTSSSVAIPKVGDIMIDTDTPHWSNDARVRVTGISEKGAGYHFIDEHGYKTVASENPDADPNETVVEGKYVLGNDETYAFPVSRLEQYDLAESLL